MSKEDREQIAASDEAVRQGLALAMEGVIIIDRVGQPAFADDAIYAILGYAEGAPRPELPQLLQSIQFAGNRSFPEILQDAFDSGIWRGEAAGLTALNHAILLEVAIRRLQDDVGQRLGALLVVRDVTRDRAMISQLLASQRLELIEKYNRGIGHEFKNLLTIIMAYGALISKSLKSEELQEEIRQIIDTAEQANELINLLGILTRPQPRRIEDTDLNNVLANVRSFLGKGLPINVSVSMPTHVSLPAVQVDPVELQKVLLHLALNSAEAMPGGGQVSIDVEGTEVTGEDLAHIPVREAGRYVVISVSDAGRGFTEEARRRLYEPFFTTKETGVGLGLCYVRRAIDAMDGVLRIYSEPGEGACVRIYLPVTVESSRSFAGAEGAPAPLPKVEGRVLVIDDDDDARNLARAILRKAGYHVTSTSSGADGIAAFKRRQDEVDVVLLDVVMPNLNGKETCRRLREIRKDLPIVLVSGFPPRAVRDIMGEEDIPCVTKPFTKELLLRSLQEALALARRA